MSEDIKAAELEALKTRADLLQVKYHPNIGLDALREKVKAAQAADPAASAGASAGADAANAQNQKAETADEKMIRLRNDAAKLVRIRLTCMNPAKKDWDGEIITAGNAGVGSYKRYIPFNAPDGWHVENIMYQVLKDRMCPVFYTERTKNGVAVRRSRLIREFAIELLDPLTKDELAELARRQALARGES